MAFELRNKVGKRGKNDDWSGLVTFKFDVNAWPCPIRRTLRVNRNMAIGVSNGAAGVVEARCMHTPDLSAHLLPHFNWRLKQTSDCQDRRGKTGQNGRKLVCKTAKWAEREHTRAPRERIQYTTYSTTLNRDCFFYCTRQVHSRDTPSRAPKKLAPS